MPGSTIPHNWFDDFTGMVIVSKHETRWYKNGVLHRDDGPAIVVYFSGKKQEYYYQKGHHITKKELWERKKYTKHANALFALEFGE